MKGEELEKGFMGGVVTDSSHLHSAGYSPFSATNVSRKVKGRNRLIFVIRMYFRRRGFTVMINNYDFRVIEHRLSCDGNP